MKQVHVVGLGLNPRDLPLKLSQTISAAQVLVGGQRLLDFFNEHPAVKIVVKSPLSETIKAIKEAMVQEKDVVVLADGDPGFFGIGIRLFHDLGIGAVVLHPNVTTLQVAASRMNIQWHDIKTVSMHGRNDLMPLLRSLAVNDRVAVFTDMVYNPSRLAEELLQKEIGTFKMYVFEALCSENEKIGYYELQEAKDKVFSPLNFVMFDRIKQTEVPLCPGLDDDQYLHQKGLITKKEIRAAGLSMLSIRPKSTVWDLGAGCGSVAIEASIHAYNGMVFAVERDHERVLQIKRNIMRTGAYAVDVVLGDMPECLESLPDPDRIFIGGGIGHDTCVLAEAARRLKPGGKLVFHLVLMGSLTRAIDYLNELGWRFSISQIQVSRSSILAGDLRLEALNPVYILETQKGK